MLKNVHFKAIKALHDVQVDLERLTFLVGPNGCGKSTLLDQIDTLCACTHHDPANPTVLGQAGAVLLQALPPSLYASRGDGPMLWYAEGPNLEMFSVGCTAPSDPSWFDAVTLQATADGRSATSVARDKPEQRRDFNDLIASRFSWRAQRLRLVPQYIAEPVDVRVNRLAPTGYGLASVLAEFAMNDQDSYAALQADMRSIVPHFEKLHIAKADVFDEKGVKHGGVSLGMVLRGAGRQPATAISDGTLLALALLTATHDRDLPPLVLIDDIDHGLHLRAQLTLIQVIRKVMEVRPNLQVICTTHSPYLLDAARPEEVRVMGLDAEGRAQVRPLTEYPDFQKQHRGLQTGEFWATFGESWVAGTGAAHG